MEFSMEGTPVSDYQLVDFSGGLNTKYNKASLNEKETPEALNVVFDERGMLYKRPGLSIDPSFPHVEGVNVVQLFFNPLRDGTKEMFLVLNDGTMMVKKEEWAAVTMESEVDGVMTEILHRSRPFSSFRFNELFYFGNSHDGWFKWDGTKAVQVTTIPPCDYAVVKNARVYYAGDADQKDRLFYSHQGDPEDVTIIKQADETDQNVGGIIDFHSNEVEITGLTFFESGILVFKKDSVHLLDGDDYTDFAVRRLNVATGCVAPHSVVKGDNVVYYVGHDGVYYIYSPRQDAVETTPLSDAITPEFSPRLTDAFCFYHKAKFFVFSKDKTLVFDERLRNWTKWDGGIQAVLFDDETDNVFVANEKGYICTWKKGQLRDEVEPGSFRAIRGVYSTPYLSFQIPHFKKRFKYLSIFYKPVPVEGAKIDMQIEVDYTDNFKSFDIYYDSLVWEDDGNDEEDNIWGAEFWGDMREQMNKKINIGGRGKMIKIRFENDRIDEDLGISVLVFGFKKDKKAR